MTVPPHPDEFQELLEAGRRAVVAVPPEARARLEERLGAIAGWSPNSAPKGAPSHGPRGAAPSAVPGRMAAAALRLGALKGGLLFLAGTAVGLVAKDRILPPAPRVETRVVERPTATPTPMLEPAPSAPPAASAPEPSAGSAARRPVEAHSPSPPETDPVLEREHSLIETARTALVRGDAPGALVLLAQHASEFPNGKLAELRDVLTIQALERSGRSAEAISRAEAFRRRYPQSVYLSVLDETLGTISP